MKLGRSEEPTGKTPMDVYSHWLRQAFPSARQRQQHFKSLIDKKPISHANFRLAHLLAEKRLAKLVVTPNFDDFLHRTLMLFGQPHIVCDHPATTERIDPESADIQIVHVHGTYWFYDFRNLPGEIKGRSSDTPLQAVTMLSLLNNILARHSAIVIGYSGWEDDVIMTALKRRLLSDIPINMYWFFYRRAEMESLPSFIKNHDNICAVVPPLPNSKADLNPSSGDAKLAAPAGESEPTLAAKFVLDKLIAAFTKGNPPLVDDPIGFFAGQLSASFPQDAEKPEDDIYRLREVIGRVELAKKIGDKKPVTADIEIERVRNAIRRSAYVKAIKTAKKIKPEQLTANQREALIDLVMSGALGLRDNSKAELDGYDVVISLPGNKVALSPQITQQLAKALSHKSFVLFKLNRHEEGIRVSDQLLERFGDASEPALHEWVAKALRNKGVAFSLLNRHEEAIAMYDELLQRFAESTKPILREQVAKALYNKASSLDKLDRHEEEIQIYDQLIRRFGEATEPVLREWVVSALLSKGFTLGQLNRAQDALETFDLLLQRFGEAPEPVLREQVAKALNNKGVALGKLNRGEEAIQAYEQLVQHFGEATEPVLREQVAKALNNKGVALGKLNRSEEAIQVYEQLLQRLGEATEPPLRKQVAIALINKGIRLGQLNRSAEEVQVYDQLLQRFGEATELALREQVAKALFNKGFRLGKLNRSEEEIQVYDQLLQRFGEATELVLREQTAKALINKGIALNQLKRSEEAQSTFMEVIKRFGTAEEESLKSLVTRAQSELDSLIDSNPPA